VLLRENPPRDAPGATSLGYGSDTSALNQKTNVELSVLKSQPAGVPMTVIGAFTAKLKEEMKLGLSAGSLLNSVYDQIGGPAATVTSAISPASNSLLENIIATTTRQDLFAICVLL
jgi:hypothetical protein